MKLGNGFGTRTGTDTLSVVALPQETVDTTDREGETGLGGAPEMEKSEIERWEAKNASSDLRLRVGLGAAGLAAGLATSHFCGWRIGGLDLGERVESDDESMERRRKTMVDAERVGG